MGEKKTGCLGLPCIRQIYKSEFFMKPTVTDGLTTGDIVILSLLSQPNFAEP